MAECVKGVYQPRNPRKTAFFRLVDQHYEEFEKVYTGRQDITVGMVACVQTFGNFANFHPHLHILVTDGGFGLNGTFYVLPKVSLFGLEQLFRHRVLKMMLRAGLITP